MLADALKVLVSPCCLLPLRLVDQHSIRCTSCDRRFPVIKESIIDLLPSLPAKIPAKNLTAVEHRYYEYYLNAFKKNFEYDDAAIAWGSFVFLIGMQRKIKSRYVDKLVSLLPKNKMDVSADISAGAGHLNKYLADHSKLLCNFDLDITNLSYLHKMSRQNSIDNIVFIRADHFRFPARSNSFNFVTCNDTLNYGPEHDEHLLGVIRKMLNKDGCALLDFVNKAHQLPFKKIRYGYRYTKSEILEIFLRQELDAFRHERILDARMPIINHCLPAVRHAFFVKKNEMSA
jgi:ubiquinone/menaquinone biosynthesis C-methylase UbiE